MGPIICSAYLLAMGHRPKAQSAGGERQREPSGSARARRLFGAVLVRMRLQHGEAGSRPAGSGETSTAAMLSLHHGQFTRHQPLPGE
jgi:hypothetical protein